MYFLDFTTNTGSIEDYDSAFEDESFNQEEKESVESLGLKGIYYQRSLKRSYPQMEISSHVVGITDIDRIGIQ